MSRIQVKDIHPLLERMQRTLTRWHAAGVRVKTDKTIVMVGVVTWEAVRITGEQHLWQGAAPLVGSASGVPLRMLPQRFN